MQQAIYHKEAGEVLAIQSSKHCPEEYKLKAGGIGGTGKGGCKACGCSERKQQCLEVDVSRNR